MTIRTGVTPSRLALAREAARLRGEGMLFREIAERFGISISYVQALVSDPDGAKDRARKASYGGTCEDCGGPTDGSNGAAHAPRVCTICSRRRQHEERHWTQAEIVATFQRFYADTGRVPAASDVHGLVPSQISRCSPARLQEIEAAPELPHPGIVAREFGSWSGGLRAAGFTPNPGGSPRHREAKVTTAMRETLSLLGAGHLRIGAIADARGVGTRTQHQVMRTLLERGLVERIRYGVYRSASKEEGMPKQREFIVISQNGNGWEVSEPIQAVSGELAIEKVAKHEGDYVAIPARLWSPRSVRTATRFFVAQ